MVDDKKPLSCSDFDGSCCDMCHDDENLKKEELVQILNSDLSVYAQVCCLKIIQAERRMRDNEVSNQSIPKGKL